MPEYGVAATSTTASRGTRQAWGGASRCVRPGCLIAAGNMRRCVCSRARNLCVQTRRPTHRAATVLLGGYFHVDGGAQLGVEPIWILVRKRASASVASASDGITFVRFRLDDSRHGWRAEYCVAAWATAIPP